MDNHHHSSSEISCSICLDLILDNTVRSRAKLKCGHEFHLDCIGSAFNMKGEMQCPNCREVEDGQWLYVNAPTRLEDWIPDEDIYDTGYNDVPFRFHWCPFGEATQMHSSFEEVEFLSILYQQCHAKFAEKVDTPSEPQSYVVRFRTFPHASLRYIDVTNNLSFNNSWNSFRGQNEILNPHLYSAISIQYKSRHSSPFIPSNSHQNTRNPSATLRLNRNESSALVRSDRRAESSFLASLGLPESIARAHARVQVFHNHHRRHHHHQHMHHHHHHHHHRQRHSMPSQAIPSFRRFNRHRSLPATVAAPPLHDHNARFFVIPPSSSSDSNAPEAEHPLASHFHGCRQERQPNHPIAFSERDSSSGPSRHGNGTQDSPNQSTGLGNGPWN